MKAPHCSPLALHCVASCLLCLGNSLLADTVTNASDSGAGSLRAVIAAAASGATIDFDPSLDGQTIALTSGHLVIDKNLTIDAAALMNRVTVAAGGLSRVLTVGAGVTVTLHHLVMTGGKTPDGATLAANRDGGGIHNLGHLTLQRCSVDGNATGAGPGGIGTFGGFGGGIYSGGGGSLTLTDCSIDGNQTGNGVNGGIAGRGGGIYLAGTGTLTMNLCSLSENVTGQGGSPNGAGGSGGGLFNSAYTVTITNSTLAGSIAGDGAATGNSAGGNGGAIYNESGTVQILYGTVAGNRSGKSYGTGNLSRGGGIFNNNAANALVITNTIVADNSAPGTGGDIQGTYTVSGRNLVETQSHTPVGGIRSSDDPSLGPLADNGGPTRTMRLLPGSVAVDRALGTTVPTDQRGMPRGNHGAPDIGAYEAGGGSVVINTPLDENNGLTVGAVSLREALLEAEPYAAVTFDPATFSGPDPRIELLHGELLIPQGLTVNASALPRPVTLDARGASRVLRILDGQILLQNLVITGGNAVDGGGISCPFSGTHLTLVDCTVSGNTAGEGGGISGRTITLLRSTVSDNSAGRSGGIHSYDEDLTLVDCTVSGNTASEGEGGGISGWDITLLRSTVSGNSSAGWGGGIYCPEDGWLSLTNSTISGDSAVAGGGLGLDRPSEVTITHSTVSANTAPSGAGVSGGDYTITNSIVAGNFGSDSYGPDSEFGHNILSGDPRLAPLGDYGGPTQTMPPLPGSPAIDTAVDGLDADQRGLPRPRDGNGDGTPVGDVGAAEYTPANDLAHFWPLDLDGDGIPFGVEFALGSDPWVADPRHGKSLSLPTFTPGGQVRLTFGLNAAAAPHSIWVLKRSLDLLTWAEAYRFDGPSLTHIAQPGFTGGFDSLSNPVLFIFLELNPPPRAYYRFEAIRAPQP